MINTNKPKILVLTSSYPKWAGDINGNFVYELSNRLKNNYEIHILAPSFKGSLSYEEIDGLTIHRHKQFPIKGIELAYGTNILAKINKNKLFLFIVPFYLLMQFISLVKIVKKEKINIIHAHWIIPQGIIAVVYKIFLNKKIKILATAHGSDINSFNNFIGTILKKFVLKNIDELSVVSVALKNKAISYGYMKDIYVYPMGVDTMLFSKKMEMQLQGNMDRRNNQKLLFVGELVEKKGIRLLIEAMPKITKSYPNTILEIIGDGYLKIEMATLVEKLGMSSNIKFLGIIPNNDLPQYYNSADLFILPSQAEGFGLVIAEAMSCECIALASDLPAIRHIIDNRINGFLLPDISTESIVKSVLEIFSSNAEKRNEMKLAARKKIIANFDWQIAAKNYDSLYKQMLVIN